MLKDYQIRIIANAVITRYERGEGKIAEILSSYDITEDDKNLVLARIYSIRPDIEQEAGN